MRISALARGLIAGDVATAVMDASQTSIIPTVGAWIQARRGTLDSSSEQAKETGDDEAGQPLSSPATVASRIAGLGRVKLGREQAEVWGNRVH